MRSRRVLVGRAVPDVGALAALAPGDGVPACGNRAPVRESRDQPRERVVVLGDRCTDAFGRLERQQVDGDETEFGGCAGQVAEQERDGVAVDVVERGHGAAGLQSTDLEAAVGMAHAEPRVGPHDDAEIVEFARTRKIRPTGGIVAEHRDVPASRGPMDELLFGREVARHRETRRVRGAQLAVRELDVATNPGLHRPAGRSECRLAAGAREHLGDAVATLGIPPQLRWRHARQFVHRVGAYDARVSRSRRRLVLVLLALAVVAWGTFAVVSMVAARREAQRGYDVLVAAQSKLTVTDLLHGKGERELEVAGAHFAAAQDRVGSAWIAPLEYVPWLGRQLRSVDALTRGARDVTAVGVSALRDARARMDAAGRPDGAARVALVHDLAGIARRAQTRLDGIGLGPDQALLSTLRDAHDKFDDRLDGVRRSVRDLVDAADGLSKFLAGPSHYLVIAANNSEMRAGSGAFLSLGEMTVRDGRFTLGAMAPAAAVAPPVGSVQATDSGDRDLADRFGWLSPTADFRELAVTARLDVVAPLAVRMWEARGGAHVDGVLVLDPVALQALLRTTGPVEVEGTTYTADNLIPEVFVEQYRGVSGAPDAVDQIARRDKLSKIARASLDRLETGNWKAADLVDALRKIALGRHLLAWSSNAEQQRAWSGAHVAGHFGADAMLVSLQNRSGNKLDQFVPIDGQVTTQRHSDGSTKVRATLTITNAVPQPVAQWPRYVVGPYSVPPGIVRPESDAGLYEGLFSAEIPGLARDAGLEVDGKPSALSVAGPDGPDHVALGVVLQIRPGQQRQVVVSFELPAGSSSLEIEPSARVLHPMLGRAALVWKAGRETWSDDRSHRIHW